MKDPISTTIVIIVSMIVIYFVLSIIALFGAILAGLIIGSVGTFLILNKKPSITMTEGSSESTDLMDLKDQINPDR